MVEPKYVQSQLEKINFGKGRVNRAEVNELHKILLEGETIYECVSGFYEGGVALLVATDIRVLLIDKKPMGFLNVDDVRFDMISNLDYSHRILGAQININCGMRSLMFKSYNQQRLRKLIGHVQQRISEIKREMNDHASVQKQHLEDINKQLQMYLMAQQQALEKQIKATAVDIQPLKPSPQLADYLFAQRLLEDFHNGGSKINDDSNSNLAIEPENKQGDGLTINAQTKEFIEEPNTQNDQELLKEIVEDGRREVFGLKNSKNSEQKETPIASIKQSTGQIQTNSRPDMALFNIAYAKLPYLLKTRRYRQPFMG